MPDGSQRIQGERPVAASRETLRRVGAYVLRSPSTLVLGLVCSLITAATVVLLAKPVGELTGTQASAGIPKLDKSFLLIIALSSVKLVTSYGQIYMLGKVAQSVGRDLRTDLFGRLQALPIAFFDRRRSGHLMSVMANDVMLVQGSALNVGPLVGAPFQVIASVVKMCLLSWQLSLLSLAFLPLIYLLIRGIGRRMRKISSVVQMGLADLSRVTEETIAGARIVKSFGMEDHEVERFTGLNWRNYRASMKGIQKNAILLPTLEFMGVLAIGFIIWFGGRLVAQQAMTRENLIEFIFLLWAGVYLAVRHLGGIHVSLQQAMAAGDRIFDLMDQKAEVQEAPGAASLDGVRGAVQFEDVGFAYGEEERVLDGVSFTIDAGRTVALVGPSGAGKTTIASLVPRFYDVQSGAIRIDGIDIREVTLRSLRRQIAIVPQETMLFGGSVGENIAYGRPDASDTEIVAAATAANAHRFITELPDGYDTIVGERGCLLSGGQRQRIAIARALLRDPRILILDEATSSLDAESEVLVQEALEKLMRSRTTLVIAHRLSTVKGADRILVMDHGRIVESGTHDELVGSDGLYRRLCASQLGGANAGAD